MTSAQPLASPAGSLRPRRLALALLGGIATAALLALLFPPGRYDLTPADLAGTMGQDETYWSAPARARAGQGSVDRYDHGCALSLALPQNVASAVAFDLGLPFHAARCAGSFLAAFVLGTLLVALRRPLAALGLAALLLSPPVWGHLASDLGEGPAVAIVAAWVFAAASGRWALAGVLCGIGLHQKACGLFLGAGLLAGVLASGAGRGRRLVAAGAGFLAGVGLCVGLAAALFGDDPVAFVTRPWTTTGEVWARPGIASIAVESAFAGFHGFGRYLGWLFLGAACLAPWSRPGWACVAAAAAGLLFRGYLATAWRFVPVLPLLVLPAVAVARRSARPTADGIALALLALPQAVGALAADLGLRSGGFVALMLAGATVAAAVLGGAAWLRASPRLRLAAPCALLALAALTGPVRGALHRDLRSTRMHDLAARVATRVPEGATLVGQPVIATRFLGTVLYAPFSAHWLPELSDRPPPLLWRLWAVDPGAPRAMPPPYPGYRVSETEFLGTWPYSPASRPRDVSLDLLRHD